ncbi:MAG: hypothetical protein QOJ02_871 [Acidobacteriota bacterium]|jgi:hypothetical protein|nr:hypothetical protein [Acidobacteriota bacterium]
MSSKIFVKEADIIDFSCDVLVLKYAQDFYGADAIVSELLGADPYSSNYSIDISLLPGQHFLLPSQGKIAAKNVLFVGVVELSKFDYGKIRALAKKSLRILAKRMPEAAHIGMTIHGVGYGLDEKESFLAQIAGLFDAFHNNAVPPSLKRITIVDKNHDRAVRLRRILKEHLPSESSAKKQRLVSKASPPSRIASAGLESKNKPHVFVAMPFSKQMEDVYRFGIMEPVDAAGFLCERVDMEIFIGDILTHIKLRIETATLIIADLTGANPNVYLEVGYAWGKNRPALFLAQNSDEIKFDLQGQRCIIYETIYELADKLKAELAALKLNLTT